MHTFTTMQITTFWSVATSSPCSKVYAYKPEHCSLIERSFCLSTLLIFLSHLVCSSFTTPPPPICSFTFFRPSLSSHFHFAPPDFSPAYFTSAPAFVFLLLFTTLFSSCSTCFFFLFLLLLLFLVIPLFPSSSSHIFIWLNEVERLRGWRALVNMAVGWLLVSALVYFNQRIPLFSRIKQAERRKAGVTLCRQWMKTQSVSKVNRSSSLLRPTLAAQLRTGALVVDSPEQVPRQISIKIGISDFQAHYTYSFIQVIK